jgi:hypothetical protein
MGNTGEQERIIKKTAGKGLAKDIFFADGHYQNLRAMGTTKADVGLPNVPDNIVAEVEQKETAINLAIGLIAEDVAAIKGEREARLVETPNLLPTAAKVVALYETTKEFTITAVDPTPAGEGIIIKFVDPEDVSQSLSVSLVEGEIIISHATDVTGEISTLAGNLETAINEHAEVGLLVQAAMGDAGTMDFVGQVVTAGHAPGIECKAGHIFSDGNDLYIALNDVDGQANETTDFKKVALSAIV